MARAIIVGSSLFVVLTASTPRFCTRWRGAGGAQTDLPGVVAIPAATLKWARIAEQTASQEKLFEPTQATSSASAHPSVIQSCCARWEGRFRSRSLEGAIVKSGLIGPPTKCSGRVGLCGARQREPGAVNPERAVA